VKPTPEELSRERFLLGESHHRVKNHLQIITSMLNLQMSTLHNDEARDALRSSQNRVRSIAALHQHLFQLATGAAADFKAFAAGLITHLRECYQVDEERVSLDLAIPDRPVPEEWLMPLALTLNDMVSNAFKHAFPGRREGSIRVALSWQEHEGELSVVDNGVGMPADFTHHDSPGLGLKILRVFAGQIGGQVKIHGGSGEGTVFQLVFPVASEEDVTETAEQA
jgi:two-component sensor histidine kinase